MPAADAALLPGPRGDLCGHEVNGKEQGLKGVHPYRSPHPVITEA
jgi:hypothetical protein